MLHGGIGPHVETRDDIANAKKGKADVGEVACGHRGACTTVAVWDRGTGRGGEVIAMTRRAVGLYHGRVELPRPTVASRSRADRR